jgi:hypothetical protein
MKIELNEPCPCGGGIKYKRYDGRLEAAPTKMPFVLGPEADKRAKLMLAHPTGTDDRKDLASLDPHADVADQTLARDSAGQILGFERHRLLRSTRRLAPEGSGREFSFAHDAGGFDDSWCEHSSLLSR